MKILAWTGAAAALCCAAAIGFFAARSHYRSGDIGHFTGRSFALQQMAAQFPKGRALIIGDSRVENAYIPELCGLEVFNAGIGNTAVSQWPTLGRALIAATKPSIIVIAVGVNDAHANTFDADQIARDFQALVASAREGPQQTQVIVSEVMPTDPATKLGGSFDPGLVSRINAILRRLPATFAKGPTLGSGDYVDGLHFTPAATRAWVRSVSQHCRS